jgi:hypothetical protein
MAKDPDFIKVGFHIGRYITVVVNIEAERADIKVLKSDLDSGFTLPLFPQFSLHSFSKISSNILNPMISFLGFL